MHHPTRFWTRIISKMPTNNIKLTPAMSLPPSPSFASMRSSCHTPTIGICHCIPHYLAFGIEHVAFGFAHFFAFGIWHLAFGIWHLALRFRICVWFAYQYSTGTTSAIRICVEEIAVRNEDLDLTFGICTPVRICVLD